MSTSWAGGSTRRWRKTRALVLVRDGWTCQLRLPGVCVRESNPMHVHHVRGKQFGDDMNFLVAACGPCNIKIGDPTKGTRNPAPKPMTRW